TAVNSAHRDAFINVFTKILDSGRYIQGREVSGFEGAFAAYCGVPFAIGAGNGLDALWLIMEAWKVQGKVRTGDEVVIPANTYIATILAVLRAGLKPVLVEPDRQTYNIDI